MGTGIYRLIVRKMISITRVPCGYRDIPHMLAVGFTPNRRSLWVQGYTACYELLYPPELRVPCGYRDIPVTTLIIKVFYLRSLWVQGYTGKPMDINSFDIAFPVGTGIYRFIHWWIKRNARVPCGYRDIPKRFYLMKIHH